MDFIPNELCYQFFHNGNRIDGFIHAAPDLPFLVGYMNKVFVDNDVDLQFNIFPAQHLYPSLVRAPSSVEGDFIGPLTPTMVIRVSGNDTIKFRCTVAGFPNVLNNGASVFEMFFVDQANAADGLKYALNSKGLFVIDEILNFQPSLIYPPLGISKHHTLAGEFLLNQFRIDYGSCVVTIFKSEKYPDTEAVDYRGGHNEGILLEDLYTIPADAIMAFEVNSQFSVNLRCTRIMSGVRDEIYNELQAGNLTQPQVQDLLLNDLGLDGQSGFVEFYMHIRTAAEASNGCGRTGDRARLILSSIPYFVYVNGVLVLEQPIEINEISWSTHYEAFVAAGLEIYFNGINVEFYTVRHSQLARVRLQAAGPDTDPNSSPFIVDESPESIYYSEVFVDPIENTARFCLLPRSNT